MRAKNVKKNPNLRALLVISDGKRIGYFQPIDRYARRLQKLRLAAERRERRESNLLADRRRSSLSRLLDSDRSDWFLDDGDGDD